MRGPRASSLLAPSLVVMALVTAGCLKDPAGPLVPRYEVVDPPADGGGFAACAPDDARPLAVPFRSEAVPDAGGRGKGVHRVNETTFLWVWGVFTDSLHEDRITRLGQVDVERGSDGSTHVCTEVNVAAHQEVDDEPRSFVVAARFTATSGIPEGPVRLVVNWVAGCLCDPLPRGNDSASFP